MSAITFRLWLSPTARHPLHRLALTPVDATLMVVPTPHSTTPQLALTPEGGGSKVALSCVFQARLTCVRACTALSMKVALRGFPYAGLISLSGLGLVAGEWSRTQTLCIRCRRAIGCHHSSPEPACCLRPPLQQAAGTGDSTSDEQALYRRPRHEGTGAGCCAALSRAMPSSALRAHPGRKGSPPAPRRPAAVSILDRNGAHHNRGPHPLLREQR